MATEYVLSFRDLRPLGSAEQLQALIRRIFPNVRFGWTTSGLEKLQIATALSEKSPCSHGHSRSD